MDDKDMKESCSTCKHLKVDEELLRCEMFDNAIIDKPKDKQCKDSIYPGYICGLDLSEGEDMTVYTPL